MPTVCEFDEVKVSIPKKKIQKHYDGHRHLSKKDSQYFSRKLVKIEEGINKLQHVYSVVEQIKLRSESGFSAIKD